MEVNATLTTLLDKDKVIEILERSRYVSDALASVRMMEGVAVDGALIESVRRASEVFGDKGGDDE